MTIDDFANYTNCMAAITDENSNFGYSSSAYWFKVILDNNDESRNLVLHIDYPLLDEIDVFFIESNRLIGHESLGDLKVFEPTCQS